MQIKRLCKSVITVFLTLFMLVSLAVFTPSVKADVNGGLIRDTVKSANPDYYSKGGYYWNLLSEQGMRVTVVDKDGNSVSDSVDYTPITQVTTPENIPIPLGYVTHFGQLCKTDYRKNGYTLSVSNSDYEYWGPPTSGLPKMINGDSYNTLVNYFKDENVIETFLNDARVNPSDMANKDYRLLVEPIQYLTRCNNGYWEGFAFTPTELGLYSEDCWGWFTANAIRVWTKATFLSEPDIGYGAFKSCADYKRFDGAGDKVMTTTDFNTIKNYLGMWVIKLDDLPIPANTTVPVYYHIYDTLDHQVGKAIKASDFDTSTSTSFTPSTTYGIPVAACVETTTSAASAVCAKYTKVRGKCLLLSLDKFSEFT